MAEHKPPALRHGAFSPVKVGEKAEELLTALLADEATPQYLRSMAWRPQLVAYCRQLSVVELLWSAVERLDNVNELLAEHEAASEESTTSKGTTSRRSTVRRTGSLLREWDRQTGRLRTLANDLGLTPASHSKITQSLASAQFLLASGQKHPLDAAVDAALEADRRRELDGGV